MLRALHIIRALGPLDFKNIGRDALLRWVLLLPLVLGVLIRFATPIVSAMVSARFSLDPVLYYPLLLGMLVMLTPFLVGLVIGFLLLDERDEGTLTALRVTPFGMGGYLTYRMALPMLVSTVTTLVMVPVAKLMLLAPFDLLLAALSAAPFAPLTALFLGGFAENKVQGFALMKGGSVIMLPPFIAFFVQMPWQLAFGLVPTYWVQKGVWVAAAGESFAGLYFAVGLAYELVLIAFLYRHFRNRALG